MTHCKNMYTDWVKFFYFDTFLMLLRHTNVRHLEIYKREMIWGQLDWSWNSTLIIRKFIYGTMSFFVLRKWYFLTTNGLIMSFSLISIDNVRSLISKQTRPPSAKSKLTCNFLYSYLTLCRLTYSSFYRELQTKRSAYSCNTKLELYIECAFFFAIHGTSSLPLWRVLNDTWARRLVVVLGMIALLGYKSNILIN